MVNLFGESYAHHGELRHFMPIYFSAGVKSSILWQPVCSTINDHGCAKALKASDGLPGRAPFLRQIAENADHKVVVSYIPNCWASLRRWQQAQKSRDAVVTDDEFNQVDAALTNAKRQLRAFDNQLGARPDKYRERQAPARSALYQEVDNIDATRLRLRKLREKPVSEADVYGLFAGLPELIEDNLPRWNAHPQNTSLEQLAMSPPAADEDERAIAAITGGHIVGAPYTLDIDSIV